MRRILFLMLVFFVSVLSIYAQKDNGYVILVEGNSVYIDLTKQDVKIGDRFDVLDNSGYIIHPVTKKKIKKEPKIIGTLRIKTLSDEYSKAECYEPGLLSKIKEGMPVSRVKKPDAGILAVKQEPGGKNVGVNGGNTRVPVIITPTEVNDITGVGYFGIYVSDMLMEKMLHNDNITLLDRSILDAQINEIDLSGRYIDASTSIEKGKIKGAKYAIQVTMQKPDVVNIRTGVPLASVMGAIQGISNVNMGAQYFSNTHTERLKSAVSITARVIDMQTSEVVFMCSGEGQARGRVQLGLEYGALGGTQINGGVNGFKQTVTGQAIEQAFGFISNGLNKFFNGETTERVLNDYRDIDKDERLIASKGKLYLGTQMMRDEDLQLLFEDNSDYYFKYKKAVKMRRMSWIPILTGTALAFIIPTSAMDAWKITTPVGVLMFASGTACTVYMIKKGNKELRKLADIYNNGISSKKRGNWDLSLVSGSSGGLGLRFSF